MPGYYQGQLAWGSEPPPDVAPLRSAPQTQPRAFPVGRFRVRVSPPARTPASPFARGSP